MRETEKLIYARLIGDSSATDGLVQLLGGSGRIFHGFPAQIPKSPTLVFYEYSALPGSVRGDTAKSYVEYFQFAIFSDRATDLAYRLKRLFDGYKFSVPSQYTQIGSLESVFDFQSPDLFDEQLQVGRKDARYRFFVVPKSTNPI